MSPCLSPILEIIHFSSNSLSTTYSLKKTFYFQPHILQKITTLTSLNVNSLFSSFLVTDINIPTLSFDCKICCAAFIKDSLDLLNDHKKEGLEKIGCDFYLVNFFSWIQGVTSSSFFKQKQSIKQNQGS